MRHAADVVVCGAGIAGVAVARALAVTHGVRRVLLVDERPPLSLTSDKSTEAYRNWWPGPDAAMVQLMNRSIDLLEQWADAGGNRIRLNRRGYLYCTANAERAAQYVEDAARASAQGAGPVRTYRSVADAAGYQRSAELGYAGHPDGADLFLDGDAIRAHFPWLAPNLCAVLHARRCGWVSAQQLGMQLLEEARTAGAELLAGSVTAVRTTDGRVTGVTVAGCDGVTHHVACGAFVNCAGPMLRQVGALAGVTLPVFSEAHYKVSLEDTLGAVDRGTGLVILDDAMALPWDDDERAALADDPELAWLAGAFPAGIHLRPEGYGASRTVLMLWDYHGDHRYDPAPFPMPGDDAYPEVVLRGMTRLAPGLAGYLARVPRMWMDGGYYTKTQENRPLVGAVGPGGSYVLGALSGFGVMAAPACAELLAGMVAGSGVPAASAGWAAAMDPARYDDAAYVARLATWGGTGQL
jgi:glycine/D-amino acid oxidase-like deaminating enzyme